MRIEEAILHRINKAKNTRGIGTAIPFVRDATLPTDDRLNRIADDILRIYGKYINGYGTFDTDETVYRFPVLLRDHVVDGNEFIPFTIEVTKLIAAKMADEAFATGGYSLFLRYANQGRDWLLVAMLKLKPGTGVDDRTLELSDTLSFDIDHLHEAARVDLAKWQDNAQPYLTFIKKRQSGTDVSLYFREALGCTEYTDSRHNTEQMIIAFEAYCEAQGWNPEQKRTGRQRVYDHCDAKDKAGEPVNLAALSTVINDQEPEAFSTFVRENDFAVGETFKPHKRTYTRFKRISRSFGSVKLSFDVRDIETGHVDYDANNDCLVITQPPQDLIADINKYKTTDNELSAE